MKGIHALWVSILLLTNIPSFGQSGNKMLALALSNPDTVLHLNLDNIRSIPPEIGEFSNLLSLRIFFQYDSMPVLALPDELAKCKNLQSLEINGYQIENPSVLRKLENLEDLDISLSNQNQFLEVIKLIKLKSLILGEISEIPENISELSNLEYLILEGSFQRIPKKLCVLQKLKKLSLIGNFSTLPVEVGKMKSLEHLRVISKELNRLPAALFKSDSLEWLIIQQGRLKTIPKKISKNNHLKYLSVTQTSLKKIPRQIKHLTQLERLNLSRNMLTRIPEEIEYCSSLKFLNLSYNQISEIPLMDMGAMEALVFGNNQLTALPIHLRDMTSLRYLDISANNFKLLPEILYDLAQNARIGLKENEIPENAISEFSQQRPDIKLLPPGFFQDIHQFW
ncbi:MAG: leucine-rich repeat domain-containing protein [Bacteroidia bacterium]